MKLNNKKWENKITQILNVKLPIIQAPMFGVTTAEMVAVASETGALGSLPLGDLPVNNCVKLIQKTRQLTSRPFAVNIFLNTLPERNDELKIKYNRTKLFLKDLVSKNNLEVKFPEYDEVVLTDYHDQVEALIDENCKVVSFTFGIPDAQSIAKFKDSETVLIGTATSVEEAIMLEKSGIDIICVQGYEAGGHRGSFGSEKISEIGGFSLLSQIYDNVKVPLIYAGGIYDGKTLLASKLLGASGFQIGSLLLGSNESALKEFEKEKLRSATADDIILTKSFSGRYARGLQNLFTLELDSSDYILPYPYQNRITAPLRTAARLQEKTDFVNIWTGHSRTNYSSKSTKDIILELVKDVERFDVVL